MLERNEKRMMEEKDKYWIHREKKELGFKPVAKKKSFWRKK
jgi:hypothetical protein